MTLIEFFEKDAVENICSSLTQTPDRVVLLGDKLKLMQKHAQRYRAILSAAGLDVEFICRADNKNKMQTILDALSLFVERYEDCVFDLTGGEDLYLVAAGIISERYKDKNIQMHKFNTRNNTVIDGDQDGQTILTEKAPQLTVEENIRIYGGDIVYEKVKENATYQWDMTADFKEDIHIMWDICRVNPREWNTQIGVFATAEEVGGFRQDALTLTVPVEPLKDRIKREGGHYAKIWRILHQLQDTGLLRDVSCDEQTFSITCSFL